MSTEEFPLNRREGGRGGVGGVSEGGKGGVGEYTYRRGAQRYAENE